MLAPAPEPGPAEGLAQPDPGPMPWAVLGSAPEPASGPRQARAPEVSPAVAGPEPSAEEHAPDPFGIQEPATERSSGDQPPADPTPPRTRAVMASRATARPPFAAETAGRTARGAGTRSAADLPEPEGPSAARPRRTAPVPDRSPGRAPAEPPGPAAVTSAARTQPSVPAARQPARRAAASDGGPSSMSARAPAAEAPVPVARRDAAGPPAVAGRPISSGSPGAAESSVRPDPPAAGRRPAPATPPSGARPPWVADPPGVTGPPIAPSATLGPLVAAPADKPRRYSPSPDIVPAAPVVNVTIGRVEVRPPPAPPPPPPAAAPGPRPLSLAEYLERRNRGPS